MCTGLFTLQWNGPAAEVCTAMFTLVSVWRDTFVNNLVLGIIAPMQSSSHAARPPYATGYFRYEGSSRRTPGIERARQ